MMPPRGFELAKRQRELRNARKVRAVEVAIARRVKQDDNLRILFDTMIYWKADNRGASKSDFYSVMTRLSKFIDLPQNWQDTMRRIATD